MRFDFWTFALQTINVLVLLWLLSRFLFKPAAAIIAARQAEANKLLDDAAAAREQAEAERRKAEDFETQLAAGRVQALRAAEQDAATQKQALLDAAHREAERLRQATRADIAEARRAEAEAVDERASTLAVDIAAKLLQRLPREASIAGFVGGLVDAVAALPAEARAGFAPTGEPVPVKAARALDEAEFRALEEGLGRALGHAVRVETSVVPGLIAGLEIDTPHARVRNNLRADLDTVLNSLKARDG